MKPYPYLNAYKDRHGRLRQYYRRHGRRTPIPFKVGTAQFETAYEAIREAHERGAPAVERSSTTVRRGTWRWLCVRYFESTDFAQLHPHSQYVRRLILDSTCNEPWAPGSDRRFADAPLELMTPKAIAVLRDRKQAFPAAARSRLKTISRVFDWALMPENGIEGLSANPAKSLRRPRANPRGGYHSWTVEEIVRFEDRHPVGTKARLALALFLFTGQRKSDVVLFGPHHIEDGLLTFTQQKNRHRNPVRLNLPVLPELLAIIEASPCGKETFLVTEYGKPFSANGFGTKMRSWCDEAGLPHCTAHGLRKAGAVIAAQNGATPHQLMSIFGWRTLAEAERYTKAADRKRIAAGAMPLITRMHGVSGAG